MLYEPTVISQYANSPIMGAIMGSFESALIPAFDVLYDDVWNVDTAVGYGLDVWGRIVGVSRVLHLPAPGSYFGFNYGSDNQPYNQAPWYHGAQSTTNYALGDDAYRQLILAKAALNITNASASSINAILMALFPTYGNCYVRDNLDMTMTYVFGATLTPVDYAIVTQSGVLPRPAGVSATVEP